MSLVFKTAFILAFSTFLGQALAEEKPKTGLEELRLTKDENKNDLRALKTEMLVSKSEANAVQQLNKLLKRYKGTGLEPDLYFRLGELYIRQSKTDRFFELHRKSSTVVRFAPQKIRSASSRKNALKAVETFQLIESRFPRYSEMDSVLFNHAFTLEALDQNQKAHDKYMVLIRKYSDSQLVPDAHLAVGEMAFEARKYSLALEHFNKVKTFPESRVYPYGLYKAAWALYNVQQVEAGIKDLENVIQYGRMVREKGLDARLDLRKEALQDLVLFFKEKYPAKRAFTYFKDQAGDLEFGPLLMSLAQLYHGHSQFRDEEVVLKDFLSETPSAKEAPDLNKRLIYTFEATKRQNLAVDQMQRMLEICQAGSSWARAQAKSKESSDLCKETLRETSLQLASNWLRLWKKGPQQFKELAAAAERTYPIYLQVAPVTKESTEARFAFAELLFQREKFFASSDQYEKVCELAQGGELSHNSCYASVVAMQKGTKDIPKNKWDSKVEARFIKQSDIYLAKHLKGKHRLDVEFEIGLVHYEKSRLPQAQAIFQKLGNEYAKTEKGQKSQDLYLDILNTNKNFIAISAYSSTLLRQGASVERKGKLQGILEEAEFLQIQKLEEDKKVAEAISAYTKFSNRFPTSKLADKASWNYSQLLLTQREFIPAARSLADFAVKFPKNPKAEDALVKAAEIFESVGQLGKAAGVLENLMDLAPSKKWKWALMAADYWALEAQFDKAKSQYLAIMANGNPEQKKDAKDRYHLLLQNRFEQTGDETSLRALAASDLQPYRSWAQVRILNRTVDRKQWPQAFQDAMAILKTPGATPAAKAEARFVQATILQNEFDNQSTKSSVERLASVIGLKTEKLDKAIQAYQDVIRYGDPQMSMRAYYQMSRCYDQYALAMKNMPIPKGLAEDDAQAFRDEIQKLTLPIVEKRVEILAQAYQTGRKLKFYSEVLGPMKRDLDKANGVEASAPFAMEPQPEMTVPTQKRVGS